jgi:hypothetical protein
MVKEPGKVTKLQHGATHKETASSKVAKKAPLAQDRKTPAQKPVEKPATNK